MKQLRPYLNCTPVEFSYRPEDARIVEYFAQLMRSEGLPPSLDPPSTSVNTAKLERHIAAAEGTVAIASDNAGACGPGVTSPAPRRFVPARPAHLVIAGPATGTIFTKF